MNSNKLTTSVCMCTYNEEAFIREQLDSILGQTQLPSEIIICDDRSTDRTLSILREYECQNQQISWKIHENAQNLGWRRNFRECICMASGDVVFLCDQDDIWDPHKIEVFVKAFAENDHIGLLYSDYRPLIMKGAI